MLSNIFYTASGDPLQSLDLWLPSSVTGSEPVIFVIYLHGGAWTDADQDKLEGSALLEHLAASREVIGIKIACASLNYRLSLPNSQIQHPDHMHDVAEAIRFLKRNYDLSKCLLVGHSAGATLAVQVFHEFRREVLGMVLFNGIYDLPELVDEYPSYNSFVAAAFGPLDRSDWQSPSPTHIISSSTVRKEHRQERIILAHSDEDELLSGHQSDLFEKVLRDAWVAPIQRLQIHGKHDDSPHSHEMQEICRSLLRDLSQKLLAS